jgi:AAA family ATP:ADP antiporter
VRRGEVRALAQALATLVLLISAHTALETARDSLLLTHVAPRFLGAVYVAVALCALPAAIVAAWMSERFGPRRVLGGGLLTAAATLVALFFVPTSRASVIAVYVTSALVGAVLVPLFWSLMASIFTVAQGRRLLGPVAAAGVVGGAIGSGAAAALLTVLRVEALLVVSAGVLVVVAGVATLRAGGEDPTVRAGPPVDASASVTPRSFDAMREEPFLRRIALLVVVSTAAAVTIDYFFKWTVARTIPHEHLAPFVARYYAVLNVFAVAAQLLASGALVRRIGVATSLVVTPLLIFSGAVGVLATGGALAGVAVLRAVDGTLLNSVHRVTTELVYLPVPSTARARAKPFIDGALARTTQAALGALFLVLGAGGYFAPRVLAALAAAFVAAWLAVAVSSRLPYLDLLRRAIASGESSDADVDPIDLESAETLVQHLASENPRVVLGAMSVLARRGRGRLIPALVLLHENEAVLIRALRIFATSQRDDWIGRARRLLADPRDAVRMSAAHALAMVGRLDVTDMAADSSPRVRGYVALHLALGKGEQDVLDDPEVREVLGSADPSGVAARLGLLEAIADAPRTPRVAGLLAELETRAATSREWTEALAAAVASQQASELVPRLVPRLTSREGREAVRSALASLGAPALAEVWGALLDRARDRSLRVHLPGTLARFGSEDAAERLLRTIETERDGLVRYKAIRSLGQMVAENDLRVDRRRVERLSHVHLEEHFRLLGLRAPFDGPPPDGDARAGRAPTERLLLGLLDDKVRQSLERTFRLLKIAHPREDIHRVHLASLSQDRRARANAAEFLDTLLRRRDQRGLRELLRIVTDDLPVAERVLRAAPLVRSAPPSTRDGALARLIQDTDAAVASLAQLHRATLTGKAARVVVGSVSLESQYA